MPEVATLQPEQSDSGQALETILNTALKIPGIKVDRQAFLADMFSDTAPNVLTAILSEGPVSAGCSRTDLDRRASSLVMKRTMQSSGVSFAAGLPGGLAMAATIPADTLQFFGMALRMAQELSYLYGGDDLWQQGGVDEEQVRSQLILYCGVMFGVSGSSAAVKAVTSAVAKQVAKTLPQKALTKTVYYPIVKQVAKLVGIKMTKSTFAKGVSKAIPVLGGVVSGGLTLASMRPMGKRLADTLSEANFAYTEADAYRDLGEIVARSSASESDVSLIKDVIPKPTVAPSSIADDLLKYKELLDAELITHEEFDAFKEKLLKGGD